MRFILTSELGRLTKWLRILGFDSEYFQENKPSSLIIQALRDNRIILTRNQRLPRRAGLKIVWIESDKLIEQIATVLKTLQISLDKKAMFSRCTLCNIELKPVGKDKVKDRVPEYVFQTQEEFMSCLQCRRLYWQGTHWGNVKNILEQIIAL